MQSAIITVKWPVRDLEFDLEVPTNLASQRLIELIAHNLNLSVDTKEALVARCVKPAHLRQSLRSDQSLAEAGLWDGIYLEVGPDNSLPLDKRRKVEEELKVSWISIETGQPITRTLVKPAGPRQTSQQSPSSEATAPPPNVQWNSLIDTDTHLPGDDDDSDSPGEGYILEEV